MARPLYITTAISYPNGPPHIGHAYEAVAADAIARYHRLAGRDVRFQTGTDEHGLKMAQAAAKRAIAPAALADEMAAQFQSMCDRLNVSYDRFLRTSHADHHAASQAIWRRMADAGDLYLDRYEGWYSVRDEAYYDASELIDATDANGGSIRLSPQGTPVEWTVEESWFFRLSAYQDRLLRHIADNPDFIQPDSRRNEMLRFIEGGLRDLSISRTSFDWGVQVPGDDAHVMYVWVDALTNYLTGLGFPDESGDYATYWAGDGDVLHVIGKDIVRFHAVYWPAFLMSAGLPLPDAIFGHGFLLNRGEKMSKSVGNVVDPGALVDAFGVDQLRYVLLADVVFGSDGSYSFETIVERTNADLANNFGNLVQRCLSIIAKNCDGHVPDAGTEMAADTALLASIDACRNEIAELIGSPALAVHSAIDKLRHRLTETNQYFADQAPWTLRKNDPARADTVLFTSAEAIRRLAILFRWIVPESADKILDLLGQGEGARDFGALDTPLAPGTALPPPSAVFPRLELPPIEPAGGGTP